ncbi:MAG TPA: glycosyltransferase family 2 protein [Sphingomicrobium sp.]|nr:glycosyltransferase family 2 protein [Sphingomicrobium sp.]
MIAVTVLIAAILAPIVVITGFFAAEVLAGISPVRAPASANRAFRALVVIPAHDEQAVIGRTVTDLMSEAGDTLVVLVVADNCSDDTAGAARSAGAEVLVRTDPERRGKGFALGAARAHLAAQPPDVVVVMDADCRMDGASLHTLAASAAGTGRACQAVNLLAPDLAAPVMVQISTFAFVIKNLIRQRGLQRLAGRAHLTGTGMALPWDIFEHADLGGANIVEDLALGLELAKRAASPIFIEGATVWSPAASPDGTLVQRRRWEGGYLATALRAAPRAFSRSLARADLRGLLAALDLSIPPLALLLVLNGAGMLLAIVGLLIGAAAWPLLAQLTVGILTAIALGTAWSREGRRFASGATLLRLPMYVIWKLPMYLGLIRRGAPKEWLRTGR